MPQSDRNDPPNKAAERLRQFEESRLPKSDEPDKKDKKEEPCEETPKTSEDTPKKDSSD